jgi:hypothetical protein
MGLGSCLPSGDAFAFEPNHLETSVVNYCRDVFSAKVQIQFSQAIFDPEALLDLCGYSISMERYTVHG